MPFAPLKEKEIYYEIYGAGAPVILIHGLSVDSAVWMPVISLLKKSFTMIRFDLRGSGKTKHSGAPFTIENLASDIAELMDLLEIKTAHIVGHSMGGRIAMTFAALFPSRVKKLCILNSLFKLTLPARRHYEGLSHLRKNYKISAQDLILLTLPWIFSHSFLEKQENIRMIRELATHSRLPQAIGDYDLQINALIKFDGYALISMLRAPILIIAGQEDILTPAEEMKKIVNLISPKCTYVEQADGAHSSIIETPGWISKHLLQFLAEEEAVVPAN